MSIKVEGLTKIYGDQKAVDNISFEVAPGEVLGFLGPNGAGKSTTMKILTSYIPQSSGKAAVCGFDVEKNSLEVRKRIGYLPENNPLYLDMYVPEFLAWSAKLSGYKKIYKKRIEEIIDLTGLQKERTKLIGQLSKGYKQRVGLAQAILHDPEVLILDEPTSGLDPNQLVEIRALIKSLGKEKTVILSTHIMQEVQAVCDRVVIINQGKIVADDTIDHLQATAGGGQVTNVEFKNPVPVSKLRKIKDFTMVEEINDRKFRIFAKTGTDTREQLFRLATSEDNPLLTVFEEKQELEEVFRALTINEKKKG
jgi:gliding motility-associated transport system ATP-binding protein